MFIFIRIRSRNELKQDLRTIEASGLIQIESPEPELKYTFSNSLVARIVYELMLYSHRRPIHKEIIRFYLEHYPGQSTYYPLLAYHYKQAGVDPMCEELESALDYYTKAGRTSLTNYANAEAVTFFTEAIAIIQKRNEAWTTEGISMERKLAQAYYNLGQYEEAEKHYKNALELVGIPARPKDIAAALRKKPDSFTFFPSTLKKKEISELKHDVPHRHREAVILLVGVARIKYYASMRNEGHLFASLALHLKDDIGNPRK